MGATKKKIDLKKINKIVKTTSKATNFKGNLGKVLEIAHVRNRAHNIGKATCIDPGENWIKTGKWLNRMETDFPSQDMLNYFGALGVKQLYEYTPKRTGKTAASWSYEIEKKQGSITLYWTNNNIVYHDDEKVSVAVLIQNGHATPTGKWVEGRDFIRPALEPVIKKLNEKLSEEARGE